MIKCPSCASNLRYDIATAKMKCDHCGSSYDPYQFENEEKGAELSADYAEENEAELPLEKRGLYQSAVFICPSCGAELTCQETDVTAVCAYCGGANIVFHRLRDERRPDTIIPFSVTKEQCKDAYIKAVRKSFLTPSQLKKADQIESFRGIYLPYRQYEASVENGTGSFSGKTKPRREGNEEITDLCDVELDEVNGSFTVYKDGSVQFDDLLSECLEPYETKTVKPFSPGFLQGFYADTYDDPALSKYEETFREEAADFFIDETSKSTEYTIDEDSFVIHNISMQQKEQMRPVWFMSYRRDQDRLTYATVNGSTGKVVADFPISVPKYIGFVAGLTAILFAILMVLQIMPRPHTALVVTAVLAGIAGMLNLINYDGWFSREKYGTFSFKKRKRNKSNKSNKKKQKSLLINVLYIVLMFLFPIFIGLVIYIINLARYIITSGLWVNILAVGAFLAGIGYFFKTEQYKSKDQILSLALMLVSLVGSLTVVIMQPLNYYYYIAAFANALLFVGQFVLIVYQHNQKSYRRPPQFNKSGGDDHA